MCWVTRELESIFFMVVNISFFIIQWRHRHVKKSWKREKGWACYYSSTILTPLTMQEAENISSCLLSWAWTCFLAGIIFSLLCAERASALSCVSSLHQTCPPKAPLPLPLPHRCSLRLISALGLSSSHPCGSCTPVRTVPKVSTQLPRRHSSCTDVLRDALHFQGKYSHIWHLLDAIKIPAWGSFLFQHEITYSPVDDIIFAKQGSEKWW